MASILSNEELLKEAIKNCKSQSEILEYMGLRSAGGNFNTLKKYAKLYNLELPKVEYEERMSRIIKNNTIPNEEIFVKNSSYSKGQRIKKRLLDMGWKDECAVCGVGSEWNGKPLTLQLEHKDGDHSNNELSNLEILCPNCHSQTDTHSGKSNKRRNYYCGCGKKILTYKENCPSCNAPIEKDVFDEQSKNSKRNRNRNTKTSKSKKIKKSKQRNYCKCGKEIQKTSQQCNDCRARDRFGINYPPIDDLIDLVVEHGYSEMGRRIGVSATAVKKHIKKHQPDFQLSIARQSVINKENQ